VDVTLPVFLLYESQYNLPRLELLNWGDTMHLAHDTVVPEGNLDSVGEIFPL